MQSRFATLLWDFYISLRDHHIAPFAGGVANWASFWREALATLDGHIKRHEAAKQQAQKRRDLAARAKAKAGVK